MTMDMDKCQTPRYGSILNCYKLTGEKNAF